MKAAIRTGLLGLTVSFTEHHPLPIPSIDDATSLKPTDVLIKVKSAAINPADYKLPRVAVGKILGIDFSGVIEQVGSGVEGFKIGDAVYGMAVRGKRKVSGSLAEYTIVGTEDLAKKPEYLSFDEAAALPIAYLTSLQSLRAGNVKEGSTALIIGASGGCGLSGVQLAIAMKLKVVGVCSKKNFQFVRDMCGGCEKGDLELVDYTNDAEMKMFREENAGKFDCIYDTVTGSGKGEDYTTKMPTLLKESTGQYIQINGSPSTWAWHIMKRMKSQRKMIMTAKSKSDLEEIPSLLEKIDLKPHLNIKFFDEKGVVEGFEELKGRRVRGKIVFHISD